VEAQVSIEAREVVSVEDVQAAKKRFLNRMDEEGFQVEACFGSEGCPNPYSLLDAGNRYCQ